MNTHLEQLAHRLSILRRAMFGGDELLQTPAALRLGPTPTPPSCDGVRFLPSGSASAPSNNLDRRIGQAMSRLDKYKGLETAHDDLVEIADMMQGDDSLDSADLISDTQAAIDSVNQAIDQFSLHSIPNSTAPCTLSVTAGAGGADSEDWAFMLSAMYAAHARRHRMELDWLEQGPRTFAFQARGAYPLGLTNAIWESGISGSPAVWQVVADQVACISS